MILNRPGTSEKINDFTAGLRLAEQDQRSGKADACPGPAHEYEGVHERLGHNVRQGLPGRRRHFVGEHGRAVDVVGDRIKDVGPVDAREPNDMERKDIQHAPPEPFPDGVKRHPDDLIQRLMQRHAHKCLHGRAKRREHEHGQHAGDEGVEGLRDGDIGSPPRQMQVQPFDGKEIQEQPGGEHADEDRHKQPGDAEPTPVERVPVLLEQAEERRKGHKTRDDRIGTQDRILMVELVRQMVADGENHDEGHHGKGGVFQDLPKHPPLGAELPEHEFLVGIQRETDQQLGKRAEEHERQGDDERGSDRRQRGPAGNGFRQRQQKLFNDVVYFS